MDRYATSHFSNRALLVDVRSQAARDHAGTAVLLSRIAEVDERRLYLEEGYPSMHAFCVRDLHYSEGAAYKRITAARAARRFPQIFVAVAEGRVHLSGIVMLSRYLTSGNVDELLAAATHQTKVEIEHLIARHFPRPDLPERLIALDPAAPVPSSITSREGQLSPGTVGGAGTSTVPPVEASPGMTAVSPVLAAPVPACQLSPGTVPAEAPRPRVRPLAPQRYGFQCTLDQESHDLLQRARELTSHEVPTGDMAQVLKITLQLAVGQLEKRKFAATSRPGASRPSTTARHIPAAVKRAVRERDKDQCAFVSDGGKRCPARRMLEFDHQVPVALGGEATLENTRLLCRAHNQLAAERAFGAEFMDRTRGVARPSRT